MNPNYILIPKLRTYSPPPQIKKQQLVPKIVRLQNLKLETYPADATPREANSADPAPGGTFRVWGLGGSGVGV